MAVNINVPSQVKTYANLAAFPATGALKTIYIAEDTNKTYRWTGSVYTEISASAAMTWGAIGGTLSNQTDLQSALDAKVPTTRTLTINGVTQDLSANRTFTISTGITIGSTAIASGVVGRVLFEGAGNVVQESGNLFWDATNNRLGINTSTPAYDLELRGSRFYHTGKTTTATTTLYNLADNTTANNSYILFGIDTTGGTAGLGISGNYLSAGSDGTGTLRPLIIHHFNNQPIIFANNNAERMRIATTTGNVLINTTTDAGFRLDVNGTARVSGQFDVISGTANFRVSNSGAYVALRIGATSFVEYNATEAYFLSQQVYFSGGLNFRFNGVGQFGFTGNPSSSAQLQVDSTTKGFLPPRMTTTQKNAIATPAAGLVVYDTTLNKLCVYTTAWETVTSL